MEEKIFIALSTHSPPPKKRERKLQNNYGCPVVFINKLCEIKNKIFNTLYIKIDICAKIQNHMVFEVL